MSGQIWHGLLANLAILVVFVSIATYTYAARATWPPLWRSLSLGVLFGTGATVLMLVPVEIIPGLFSDLRSPLIALSGFFGGPLSGIVTALFAAVYRATVGGAGMPGGLLGIAIAASVGIIGHYLVKRRPIKASDIAILGAWIGLGGSAGTLFLPEELRIRVFETTLLPQVMLAFVASVLAGLALLQERQRREAFEENRTYRTIIENLPDSLNVKDAEGRFVAANPATAQLMGAHSPDALIGKTDFDFYKDATATTFAEDEAEALSHEQPVTLEQEFISPEGKRVWLSTLKVPVRSTDGQPIALITHNRDITQRKRLEQDLKATQERLATAMEQMADGLAMFDSEDRLVFCNSHYRSFFPRTGDLRVPGMPLRTILRAAIDRGEQLDIPPDGIEQWMDDVISTLKTAGEEEVHRYDGHWLHIRTSPMSDGNAMVVISDITRLKQAETELKALTAQLQILATTDGLTGLVNRRSLDERLDRELARTARNGMPISFILMDIDRFKAFNDLYGHPAGDECLKRVAVAVRNAVKRPADIVARYGGEEFAVVLPETDEDGAFAVAEACRLAVRGMALEHSKSEKSIVTISLGVASYRGDEFDRDVVELIGRADQALYIAKGAGRDRVHGGVPRQSAMAG